MHAQPPRPPLHPLSPLFPTPFTPSSLAELEVEPAGEGLAPEAPLLLLLLEPVGPEPPEAPVHAAALPEERLEDVVRVEVRCGGEEHQLDSRTIWIWHRCNDNDLNERHMIYK